MWKTSMAGVCRAYLDFTAKKTGKTLIRRALEELERAELVRVERDEDGVVQGVECIDLFVETAAAEPSAPKAEAASREEQNRPMGLREFLKSNPEYTEKSKLIQKIMAIGGAHG